MFLEINYSLTFSQETMNKLSAGLSVFTAKQLKQSYQDFVKVYDTLITFQETEAALSPEPSAVKKTDFARPVTHLNDINSMVELLVIERGLSLDSSIHLADALQYDFGPISVVFNALKALVTEPSFQSLSNRITKERLNDIQEKIRETGSSFEIPNVQDASRRLLWSGQFLRPSSAIFSRGQIKKYKFYLFNDLLIWTNFRDTSFKGLMTISKDIVITNHPSNPCNLLITVYVPRDSQNQTLEFGFERYSAKNLMTYWIKSCASSVSALVNSAVEIKIPKRIKTFFSGLLGKSGNKTQEMVSRPFNLRHEYHVNKDLEWKFDEGSFEDQFEVLDQIGKGGFAVVHRAFHTKLKQIFAIKMIQAEDTKKLAVIRRELDILKKLRNEHIVTYYGCAGPDSHSRLWIMMDYCRGGSLYDLMKATGPLDEEQISYVMDCTLKALLYLHSQEIIHRDIKARNILLSDDGSVKLADFGVSAHVDAFKPDETKTGVNAFVGTP
jgi:hypothetical protein